MKESNQVYKLKCKVHYSEGRREEGSVSLERQNLIFAVGALLFLLHPLQDNLRYETLSTSGNVFLCRNSDATAIFSQPFI